jgi:hypothetical protein
VVAVWAIACPIAAVAAGHQAAGSSAQAPAGTRTSAGKASTDHLRVATTVSPDTVSAGQVVSLIADVTPKPRMHVYAPGADNYRIVTLTLEKNDLVAARPLKYPPSEIYHFKPLDEHVPVYQKPFRLTLDVEVGRSPAARAALARREALEIKATLDYQACDDRLCFSPVSLPLSWTVKVKKGGLSPF